jgi:hypothetical protein
VCATTLTDLWDEKQSPWRQQNIRRLLRIILSAINFVQLVTFLCSRFLQSIFFLRKQFFGTEKSTSIESKHVRGHKSGLLQCLLSKKAVMRPSSYSSQDVRSLVSYVIDLEEIPGHWCSWISQRAIPSYKMSAKQFGWWMSIPVKRLKPSYFIPLNWAPTLQGWLVSYCIWTLIIYMKKVLNSD